jgi:Helix-turn-helix of DDE superfamily endonuclease
MIKFILGRYHDLENDEPSFRRLTGMKLKEFEQLHHYFKNDLEHYFSQFTLEGIARTRQISNRKNSIFTDSRDALLFVLIYRHGMARQAELALLFEIDQPKVSKYINFLQKILYQTIATHPRAMSRHRKEQFLTK